MDKITKISELKSFVLMILFMIFNNYAVASDEVLVFIGEYIKVEEQPFSEEFRSQCNCIILDVRYGAKYKVKQVLFGDYLNEEISFTAFDHYGFPSFAKQKTAILYLIKDEYGYTHLKYEWEPVTPIKNGGYASCENTTFIDEKFQIELKDFIFDPIIQVDLSHSSDYIINDYKEDPLYKIEGDTALCIKGISAEDVFKYRWPEVIEGNELNLEAINKDKK